MLLEIIERAFFLLLFFSISALKLPFACTLTAEIFYPGL
jgi:hypothetical protein